MVRSDGRISGLVDRAKALRRRRPSLPGPQEVGRFCRLAFGRERAEAIAREVEAAGGDYSPIMEAVRELEVPEAAEALRGAVCDVIIALVGRYTRAYARSAEVLTHALTSFLVAGEPRWWEPGPDWRARPDRIEAAKQISDLELAGFVLSEAGNFRPRAELVRRAAPELAAEVPQVVAAEEIPEPEAIAAAGPRRIPGEDGGPQRKESDSGWWPWEPYSS